VHALILSFTTKTQVDAAGNSITTITEAQTLYWTFFGLMLLSVVLYAASRGRQLNRLDVFRAGIPPISFVAWTMLQRATAFDAVWPGLRQAPRTAIALFVAVLLGLAAAALAFAADRKQT